MANQQTCSALNEITADERNAILVTCRNAYEDYAAELIDEFNLEVLEFNAIEALEGYGIDARECYEADLEYAEIEDEYVTDRQREQAQLMDEIKEMFKSWQEKTDHVPAFLIFSLFSFVISECSETKVDEQLKTNVLERTESLSPEHREWYSEQMKIVMGLSDRFWAIWDIADVESY